ncbi:MAG: hypothetical protein WC823_06780 [Parcubacteria group bacterium]|jgi:hypothetical protein
MNIAIFAIAMIIISLCVHITFTLDDHKNRSVRQLAIILPVILLLSLLGALSILATKGFPGIIPFLDVAIYCIASDGIKEVINCE